MQKERFLTPQEVAQELRVTPRTVYEWLRSGKLYAQQAGRFWRVTRKDLASFTRQRAHGGPVAALLPCPVCGGELLPYSLSWWVEDDRNELRLRCAKDATHQFLMSITQDQLDRGRDGDFGWLREASARS